MFPSATIVEKAGVSAVELVQAIMNVLGGMAVHHIQEYIDAMPMGSIYHRLQFLWGPVPAAKTRPEFPLNVPTVLTIKVFPIQSFHLVL